MDGAGGRAIAANGDSRDRGCRDGVAATGIAATGVGRRGLAGGGDRVFSLRAEPWLLAGNPPEENSAWNHQHATPNCGSRTVRLLRSHRCVSSATPRRARSGDRHRDRRVAAAGSVSRSHREDRGAGECWLAIHPGPGTTSTSAGTASAATSASASATSAATSATSSATPAGQEGVGEDVADGGEERGH